MMCEIIALGGFCWWHFAVLLAFFCFPVSCIIRPMGLDFWFTSYSRGKTARWWGYSNKILYFKYKPLTIVRYVSQSIDQTFSSKSSFPSVALLLWAQVRPQHVWDCHLYHKAISCLCAFTELLCSSLFAYREMEMEGKGEEIELWLNYRHSVSNAKCLAIHAYKPLSAVEKLDIPASTFVFQSFFIFLF